MEFTRVNNDVNGNPRHVCHFLDLNTKEEKSRDGDQWISIDEKYRIALKRAKKIGGRKFHNKQYGGGIVFTSYSTQELEAKINQLVNS